MNKLGSYIGRLMTTIVDSEEEGFVRDLALSELRRLNMDIEEFVRKHPSENDAKESEKTIKTLLQEEQKNGKNSE